MFQRLLQLPLFFQRQVGDNQAIDTALDTVIRYLAAVKAQSQIPVMMGFGIHKASDVEPMKDVIDGAIVGSHFIQFMEKSRYAPEAAQAYCRTFKEELNASA